METLNMAQCCNRFMVNYVLNAEFNLTKQSVTLPVVMESFVLVEVVTAACARAGATIAAVSEIATPVWLILLVLKTYLLDKKFHPLYHKFLK